jgi:hypothetical protein
MPEWIPAWLVPFLVCLAFATVGFFVERWIEQLLS